MALKLENKKAIVDEVAAVAKGAISAVTADYRGLTVAEITELRANARQASVYLKVVRNTLARRAVEGTDFDCLTESLIGPSILAFSNEEPAAPARLFHEFKKNNEHVQVKAIAINGKLLAANQLEAVAKLPTKDEALATLMATMQAPISKFVRTLAEPHGKLVRTIAAVRDSKQAH